MADENQNHSSRKTPDSRNSPGDAQQAGKGAGNGGQDSHAAGSGSSTGDPGKARGPNRGNTGVDPHGLGGAKN